MFVFVLLFVTHESLKRGGGGGCWFSLRCCRVYNTKLAELLRPPLSLDLQYLSTSLPLLYFYIQAGHTCDSSTADYFQASLYTNSLEVRSVLCSKAKLKAFKDRLLSYERPMPTFVNILGQKVNGGNKKKIEGVLNLLGIC
jgi:hypothetical protein